MNGSTLNVEVEPNDVGRKQFYEYQTQGKYKHERWFSENLDPYFFVLKYGKRQFDLVTSEYRQEYKNRIHWDGLYRLWLDWKGDRWLLRHILKWMKNLPEWIDKEEDEIEIGMGS